MLAPAKINLSLRVLGKREDGYHLLESLVAFADFGDEVRFDPGANFGLEVSGSFAEGLEGEDNLILRAARAFETAFPEADLGRFFLTKNLPVASGIGGGSADAAAALRLLAMHHGVDLDDMRLFEAALLLGADVPVCLLSQARWMRGIGEDLSDPVEMPVLPVVLVNPGVRLATQEVFGAFDLSSSETAPLSPSQDEEDDYLELVREEKNDLQPAAVSLAPVIGDCLAALEKTGCVVARMSGSGATCFGIYKNEADAFGAQETLQQLFPAWWIKVGRLMPSPLLSSPSQ